MALSKRAYIVLGIAGLAGIILVATASTASAKTPAKIPPKSPEDDGDITVQPPGPSGVPDGTLPPVTVHTDDHGNVTGVTVPGAPGSAQAGSGTPPVTVTPGSPPPPSGSIVTTIPGPPTGSPAPSITDVPPTPLAKQEIQPENDPNGSVMLARALIARETADGWKGALMPEVALWQGQVGLKPDGKFGLKSLEKMAEEVGLLPLVRYWSAPVYNKAGAVKAYNEMLDRVTAKLKGLLPASEYHIATLNIASNREKGQGFEKNPKANNSLAEVAAIFKEVDKKALADGRKVVA